MRGALLALMGMVGLRPRRRTVRTELRAPEERQPGRVGGFNVRLPSQMNRAQRRRWAARVWESRRKRRAA